MVDARLEAVEELLPPVRRSSRFTADRTDGDQFADIIRLGEHSGAVDGATCASSRRGSARYAQNSGRPCRRYWPQREGKPVGTILRSAIIARC